MATVQTTPYGPAIHFASPSNTEAHEPPMPKPKAQTPQTLTLSLYVYIFPHAATREFKINKGPYFTRVFCNEDPLDHEIEAHLVTATVYVSVT